MSGWEPYLSLVDDLLVALGVPGDAHEALPEAVLASLGVLVLVLVLNRVVLHLGVVLRRRRRCVGVVVHRRGLEGLLVPAWWDRGGGTSIIGQGRDGHKIMSMVCEGFLRP